MEPAAGALGRRAGTHRWGADARPPGGGGAWETSTPGRTSTQVRRFLANHPVPEAQQAVAQTLERLGQDVALRERLQPEVTAWLKARGS